MEGIITIIVGVIQTGAITYVVNMIIKGLKVEIKTLQTHIETQNKTIETMNKRVSETEKIGDLYKQLISDFPKAIDDYQAVITKTKDMTIYELKNKLEEQVFTIEDLQNKSKIGGQLVSQKAAGVSKLFLNKDNKDLLEFLQKIHEKSDVLFEAIFKSETFDDLLKNLNQKVEILDEGNSRDLFNPETMMKYKAKTTSFNMNGNVYMLTFDNKIYITQNWLNIFGEKYKTLK